MDRGKFNIETIKGEKILWRYVIPGPDYMTTEEPRKDSYNYNEFTKVISILSGEIKLQGR